MERILQPLYDVESADGVVQALGRLQHDGGFQVALVDIRLGDGDGYSLCEEMRRQSPKTDVILITGSTSQPDEKLYRSLEGGAFYFLFKPFERRVLRALVDRCVRLQHERRAKEEFAETLAADLARARQFQKSLQPKGRVEAAGFRAIGSFQSCDAVGGDFWLGLVERDGSLVVAVADVVGHGVSAAMYAGMLRSTLEAARRLDPDPAQRPGGAGRGHRLLRVVALRHAVLRPAAPVGDAALLERGASAGAAAARRRRLRAPGLDRAAAVAGVSAAPARGRGDAARAGRSPAGLQRWGERGARPRRDRARRRGSRARARSRRRERPRRRARLTAPPGLRSRRGAAARGRRDDGAGRARSVQRGRPLSSRRASSSDAAAIARAGERRLPASRGVLRRRRSHRRARGREGCSGAVGSCWRSATARCSARSTSRTAAITATSVCSRSIRRSNAAGWGGL